MKINIAMGGTPPHVSEILMGEDVMERVPGALEAALGGRSAYWIWDEAVWSLWGRKALDLGWPVQRDGQVILFTASEPDKRLASVEFLARRLVNAGANRDSAIIAVGGGVTGDVAGFLASIYMRGIPCFQVPTTLLAQVDSSIGGKTGVDLPEGKNLLGTFQQPKQVYIDPGFITTLPDEELRQGMSEVIKSAMIGDEVLWKFVENSSDAIKKREPDALLRVISASCLLKSRIVEADEKEFGRRRVLNLGHTVGHALEKLTGFRLKHGDCVATGMVAAATLSHRLGKMQAEDLERLESVCGIWGMPVRIPASIESQAIVDAIHTDKKRIGEKLHFIMPVRIGEVIESTGINYGEFSKILKSLGAG
ncbi:MAG TPA: 3-dehydroquinate synthase [Deltaproteobacteria bacterium]|jgi:3-dehydroquinate synthase|nr:3-dehydroquinate synthase [Deltaproteobacteria bacterium]